MAKGQVRRLTALLVLAVLVGLLLPAGAHAGKVVDNSGRRVGWASWAKVLDRRVRCWATS
jgi:hypothetical protein